MKQSKRVLRIVGKTIGVLVTVAAIVVLLTTFVFPTLRIYGTSMTPALQNGDITVAIKSPTYQSGDIVAFDYNNKIMVKRVICGPGDWLNMQKDGTVFVNNKRIDEPYVTEAGIGDCDLELPYQVPEDSYFVMGDQRKTSTDSRLQQIGCVHKDDIVGKVVVCVWPPSSIGLVE